MERETSASITHFGRPDTLTARPYLNNLDRILILQIVLSGDILIAPTMKSKRSSRPLPIGSMRALLV